MAEIPDTDPDLSMAPEAATNVATVSDLSVLHGTLARAMLARLTRTGGTAAEWSAMAKLLSDNDITSKVGQSAEMDRLQKMLKERRDRAGKIPAASIAAAEQVMDRDIGK